MKICENVHQIRVAFHVTENIRRFVHLYLITGKQCYLIDAGVMGAEKEVAAYMKQIGRSMEEIKGLFLTHAHPDHIGAASAIKKASGCTVYATEKTAVWAENIDLQFQERPIPNFYTLVRESVAVDQLLLRNQTIRLEGNLSIRPIFTPGHSFDSTTYVLINQRAAFLGDAIPLAGEPPVIVDCQESLHTLDTLGQLRNIDWYCPAWDRAFPKSLLESVLKSGKHVLSQLRQSAQAILKDAPDASEEERIRQVCKRMGMEPFAVNPLFQASIRACWK